MADLFWLEFGDLSPRIAQISLSSLSYVGILRDQSGPVRGMEIGCSGILRIPPVLLKFKGGSKCHQLPCNSKFDHMHEFISPETLISRHVLYNRKPRNHE